jgi:hypothetical protein
MANNIVEIPVKINIGEAQQRLADLREEIKKLNDSGEENEALTKTLEKEYDNLAKQLERTSSAAKSNSAAHTSLKSELRNIKEELAKLNLVGDTTSARYKELVTRAGQLTDAMGDASQAANKAASDTSNLDAALGVASVASGGFAVATGALEALGIETEGVDKAERKLMGAISLVNGVQSIANALNKDGALRVKIMAISQKLLSKATTATATATRGASLAMKGLKAAMISTGIGALVVALGVVIEKIMDFVENSKNANKELTKTQEKIKSAGESLKKTYDDLKVAQDNYKNAVREAEEAAGGNSKVLENLNKDLYENTTKYKEASASVRAYTTAVEYGEKAVEKLEKAFKKDGSKENNDALVSAQEALAANRGYLAKAEVDEENAKTKDVELNRKIAETKDKIYEDAANKRKKREEEAYEDDKKRLSDAVKNQQIEVNKKIKGTQEWADESKKLVDKTYKYDEFVAKKDSTQIKLANEAKENAIKAIEEEQFNYTKEGYQQDIANQESKVDTLISGTQKWVDESKKLADQKLAYDIFIAQGDSDLTDIAIRNHEKTVAAIDKTGKEYKLYMSDLLEDINTNVSPDKSNMELRIDEVNEWAKAYVDKIEEAYEAEEITKQEHDKFMEDLENKRTKKINKITLQEFSNKIDMSAQAAESIISDLIDITSENSQNSKKQFETNKKLRRANAIIDGAAGSVKIWTGEEDIYSKIAAEAVVVASTLTAVSKINKTQFEGGGNGERNSNFISSSVASSDKNNAIISRNIVDSSARTTVQQVLVVDEVTAKQKQLERVAVQAKI